MKRKIKKICTTVSSPVRRHPAVSAAALIIIITAGIAIYASVRYPDDRSFLQKAPGIQSTDIQNQEQLRDIISESGSLAVIPPYSKNAEKNISVLRSSGYLKTNPYARSPYVFRYVTGKTGLWLDEKNSVLLPCGSSMRFSVAAAEGSRI